MTNFLYHGRRICEFLLPCPSRGMTIMSTLSQLVNFISTPMPLAGHDLMTVLVQPDHVNFYSHAPRGA